MTTPRLIIPLCDTTRTHGTTSLYFALALALSMTLLGATTIQASPVSGSYEGVISSDSGIGLTGQTMRFDFTYDDSVAGTPSGSAFLYQSFLSSATVTIGTNVWTYNGGSSFMFLNNDDVIVFSIGTEDRVNFSSADYTGPDLGLGTTNSNSRNFTVRLSDNVPTGAPDGLTEDSVLPNPVPDPALFQTSPSANTSLSFSWTVGDPETGTFYTVTTSDVVVSSTPVPIPGPVAPVLLLTMLVASLIALRRGRSEYRG